MAVSNTGVVSLNLPQIGILARGSEEKYFEILDKRLELLKALMLRYNLRKDVVKRCNPQFTGNMVPLRDLKKVKKSLHF